MAVMIVSLTVVHRSDSVRTDSFFLVASTEDTEREMKRERERGGCDDVIL